MVKSARERLLVGWPGGCDICVKSVHMSDDPTRTVAHCPRITVSPSRTKGLRIYASIKSNSLLSCMLS
jgi:hypothetical protein